MSAATRAVVDQNGSKLFRSAHGGHFVVQMQLPKIGGLGLRTEYSVSIVLEKYLSVNNKKKCFPCKSETER